MEYIVNFVKPPVDYQMNKIIKKRIHGLTRSSLKDSITARIIHKNFTDWVALTMNANKTREIKYLNYEDIRKLDISLLDIIKLPH